MTSPGPSPSPTMSPSPPPPPVDPPFLPVPVLRLTTRQYNRTLGDLFPGLRLPALELPLEVSVGGFLNNARAQAPTPDLIERLASNANQVALLAVASPSAVLPCAPTSAAEESSCGHAFVDDFAPRALRRPLSSTTGASLYQLFDEARLRYGFTPAVRMVIEALLISPELLYLLEEGTPAASSPAGALAPLGAFELASRLSYFLWDTMPDQALWDSAERGTLLTDPRELAAQAERMLLDPKAKEAVARFHEQWLRLDKLDGIDKDRSLFPGWNEGLAAALKDETIRYVDRLFWSADLPTLLTDRHGFVSDASAEIYGVAPPQSASPVWTALDPAQRAGVLTQPGLMAAFAHETADAPILRGVFVRDRLLCLNNGSPPPNAPVDPPPPTGNAVTTRQRIELLHAAQPNCIGCHEGIDGVGFTFGHYDAIGAWRTMDSGQPVDARGTLSGSGAATDGPVADAIELSQKLAASRVVSDCVAEQWTRYALGLDRGEINVPMVRPIRQAFVDSRLDLRKLLVAIVSSEAFRLRVRNP